MTALSLRLPGQPPAATVGMAPFCILIDMSLNQPKNAPLLPGKPTATQAVLDLLRQRILRGTLAPGAKLHVDRLRLDFGVSTATMREALSRLMADNLVTSQAQRGFQVRPLSLADYRAISDARAVIETGAMRLALTRRTPAWETRLTATFRKLRLVETRLADTRDLSLTEDWLARNTAFHDALVAGCQNDWLLNIRRQLQDHSGRYLRLALEKGLTHHRDLRQEHAAIHDAALAGDADRCARLLAAHIADSVAALIPYLPED